MKTLIALGCVLSINCGNSQTQPKNTDIDQGYCTVAEGHLQALCDADKDGNSYCCISVAPTKKGKTFKEFCQEKEQQGLFLNAKCLSTVETCGEIDTCTGSK